MSVVADASPLIALAQINRFELLHQLFGQLEIPSAVCSEIADFPGFAGGMPGWLHLRTVTDPRVVQVLRQQLDRGEAEAIALALELRALLVIDERHGRHIARTRRVPVIGTLGVLVRARKRGLIPAVSPLIDELRAVEFWLSEAVIALALRQAGER